MQIYRPDQPCEGVIPASRDLRRGDISGKQATPEKQLHDEHISPDCPHHVGSKKADIDVGAKVCKAINRPEILLVQAHKMVELRLMRTH